MAERELPKVELIEEELLNTKYSLLVTLNELKSKNDKINISYEDIDIYSSQYYKADSIKINKKRIKIENIKFTGTRRPLGTVKEEEWIIDYSTGIYSLESGNKEVELFMNSMMIELGNLGVTLKINNNISRPIIYGMYLCLIIITLLIYYILFK